MKNNSWFDVKLTCEEKNETSTKFILILTQKQIQYLGTIFDTIDIILRMTCQFIYR